MNSITRRLVSAALLLGVLVWGAPASAQTTLSQTTLAVAASDTIGTVTVSSAGSIVAGWVLYVDREALSVLSISGTRVTVQRGALGTRSSAHAVGAVTYAGPPQAFQAVDVQGTCTATSQAYLPRVNIVTGQIANCVDGSWRAVNLNIMAYATLPRTPVASGAYTALPTDVLISYTTLAAASTVTLPSASGLNGKILIVKNESGVRAALSGRFITVVGTIDGSSNSALSTGYDTLRLISNGVAWFSW